MCRLIYDNEKSFWFFDENNWTFFSKLSSSFHLKLVNFLDSVDYFPSIAENYYSIIMCIPNFGLNYNDFLCVEANMQSESFRTIVSQISTVLDYYFEMDMNSNIIISSIFSVHIFLLTHYAFYNSILILFFLAILLNLLSDYFSVESRRTMVVVSYEKFLITWVNITGIKFESYEETVCVVVLWPWCIFLVFTHVFTLENNEIFFIFIEWGLPVLIGFMIILESFWIFGCHIFTYLTGAKGRRSFIATIAEDVVAFTILLSRVSLQIVRGIICGLYHDFFREISELLIDNWGDFWYFSDASQNIGSTNFFLTFLLFFIDIYVLSMALLFIYFILFLQLLFLLIAVWLFCRCWFISSRVFEVIRERQWECNEVICFLN